MEEKIPIVAICYDFDKTLSPDDMQAFTFIPSIGMGKDEFWKESNQLAIENLMDRNLAWMYQMVMKSTANRKPISREYFKNLGNDVKLYKGVDKWFDRINKYGNKNGVEVRHYIISSGLKEIIEGSSIAHNFSRIYASTFLYTADGIAEWPAQAVNYTNKTQFIFRIAKGKLEEFDDSVNDSMNEDELLVPYENFIYIGDSDTDIPCMRLVKSKGGYSIGVYDPQKNNRKKVYKLFGDDRLSFFAAADYTSNSQLSKIVQDIITSISANEKLKIKKKDLNKLSMPYEVYKSYEKLINLKNKKTKKDQEMLDSIKSKIEGNID